MGKVPTTNVHHRKARMYGGSDEPENLIRVNIKKHLAFHRLFTDPHPRQIAKRLNILEEVCSPKQNLDLRLLFGRRNDPFSVSWQLTEVWIDPEWKIVVDPSSKKIKYIAIKR